MTIKARGRIVKGFGEGRYYVNIYSNAIKEVLGQEPYPGTINVLVDEDTWNYIKEKSKKVIKGFEINNRRFHDVYYAECVVKGVRGIIVFPKVTKQKKNIIEIILPQKIDVKVGDTLEILVI